MIVAMVICAVVSVVGAGLTWLGVLSVTRQADRIDESVDAYLKGRTGKWFRT